MKKQSRILYAALTAVFTLLYVASCSLPLPSEPESPLIEQKREVSATFDAAREEFFEGIPSAAPAEGDSRGVWEDSEAWGLRERLIAEAWNAYYSGDTSAFEALLEENGLTGKFRAIADKYDIEAGSRILSEPSGVTAGSRSVSASFFDNYYTGDIFVCYGGGSSSSDKLIGWVIPGHWKHAGVLDKSFPYGSESCILSASDNTTHGFAVGYETRAKWAGESAVGALRVNGRTDSNSASAILYGRQFLGKPYSVFTSRSSNDSWYCSKIVYRAWKSVGKTLEPSPWFTDPWVTPSDLWDDNDTTFAGGDSW